MNWMKHRALYFGISLFFLLPGIYSLARFGLNTSIDFTGGSVLELNITNPNPQLIKDQIEEGVNLESLSINNQAVTLNLSPISQNQASVIVNNLAQNFDTVTEVSFTTIGPTIGQEALTKALTAIGIAAVLTLLYVAYAFKNITYGVFAILAMIHDTTILLGSFSLLGHFFGVQVDMLFVTAVLTTLSFSVHDTIVVFDRIRELNTSKSDSFTKIANKAVTETLSRSLNNSLTIIFMLLSLALLGGSTIRNFAIALLIGAITGTYSSTFTAVPLLVSWHNFRQKS